MHIYIKAYSRLRHARLRELAKYQIPNVREMVKRIGIVLFSFILKIHNKNENIVKTHIKMHSKLRSIVQDYERRNIK